MKHKDINPHHYTATSIEPIDVIDAWGLNFNTGNALKYMSRAPHKDSRTSDLLKAANYLYREATGRWLPEDVLQKSGASQKEDASQKKPSDTDEALKLLARHDSHTLVMKDNLDVVSLEEFSKELQKEESNV